MKPSTLLTALYASGGLATQITLPSTVSSHSWGGTNLYFLQGLSPDKQDAYLAQLATVGARAVRVWVRSQTFGCEKGVNVTTSLPDYETTIGQYNHATLDALDATVARIAKHGMKAIISPHDANVLNGPNGVDAYGKRWSSAEFYTQADAKAAYDARLSSILNYRSPSSGRRWRDWDEAIMAIDVQNEAFDADHSTCNANDPGDWVCGRAKHLRQLLGNSPIQISSGGIGGDVSHNCTFMPRAMSCPELDLVAVHAYKGPQAKYPNQWSGNVDSWLKLSNGKLVYVEEFGVEEGSTQDGEYKAQTADLNKGGLPWMYWQIIPQQTCSEIGSEIYGVFQDGKVCWEEAYQDALRVHARQDWKGIAF